MKLSKSKAAEMFGVTKYQIKREVELRGAENCPWVAYQQGDRPDQKWMMVDADHPSWIDFVKKAQDQKARKAMGLPAAPTTKTEPSGAMADPEIQKLEKQSVKAQLEMPIVKLKHEKFKARTAENRIKKEEGASISFQLSEFYFLGFADKLSMEALRCGPKIRRRIREGLASTFIQRIPDANLSPEVDAAVREFLKGADVHALGVEVEKMVVQEIQESVRSIKKDQRIAVEKWKEDEGLA